MPVSARGSATRLPSIITRPWLTGSRPPTSRNSVDFPQPEGPTRQTNSLRRMEIETLVRAATRSRSRETKCLETFSISITRTGSLLHQRCVDRLLVVPFRIELLRVRNGLPGEREPLGALFAPAVLLGVIVEDEGQRGAHATQAVVEGDFGDLLDVQLTGFLWVVARELEAFLDGAQEAPRQVRLLGDHLVGGDDGGREDLEPNLDEGQHDDLLAGRLGRLVLVIVVDRVERCRVEILGNQLRGHRCAIHVDPGDFVRIGAGALGYLGEIKLVAVARRNSDFFALEALEAGDPGALQHKQRVW